MSWKECPCGKDKLDDERNCRHGFCLHHADRCALCRWTRDPSTRPASIEQTVEDMSNACLHGEPRGMRYCALCRGAGTRGEARTSSPAPVAGMDWQTAAKNAIWELAGSGKPFTSEDVTDLVGLPDATHKPNGANNSVGLLLQSVSKRFGLRRVDMTKARNPQSNGRLLTVWQGRTR